MLPYVSQSMLGQFLRCPEQFRRRWVEEEIIPPGIAARRGTAVHEAARINHEQKIRTEQDMPLDALQDAARDKYVTVIRDEGVFISKDQASEKGRLLNAGLNAVVTLTELYWKEVAPDIYPALVEERITVDIGLDVPLAGTIDCLTVDNWMPDFKTADKAPAAGVAEKSLQLSLYAGLVNHLTGKYPEKLSLEVLANTKTPKHYRLVTTRGLADFEAVIERMRLMLAQVQAGIFPPCDPGNWMCSEKWCGYALSCKYYRR